MPETPEYYFKRADEIESAGATTTDASLKREFQERALALRAMGDRLRSRQSIGKASDAEIERLAERMTDKASGPDGSDSPTA